MNQKTLWQIADKNGIVLVQNLPHHVVLSMLNTLHSMYMPIGAGFQMTPMASAPGGAQ